MRECERINPFIGSCLPPTNDDRSVDESVTPFVGPPVDTLLGVGVGVRGSANPPPASECQSASD